MKNLNFKQYMIATLGSHSALLILKGAKDEGFGTLIISTPDRVPFYKRFPFIDEIITVGSFSDFHKVEDELKNRKIIIIPHGSFVAYLGIKGNKKITIPYFGNKKVLDWESDRNKQNEWMLDAKLNPPQQYETPDSAEYPVIVKTFGAAGGSGYFLANNKKDLVNKLKTIPKNNYVIQKYIIGIPLYIHYFYSPILDRVEILGIDRRTETNVDGIGRIPFKVQQEIRIDPSYVVVANSPLILRESMLPEAYAMGDRVVESSKKIIDKRGMYGPFCLETIITPDMKFNVIEISTRIVAGTILYQQGSPYSWMIYNEPMSMGRRIAREIRTAIEEKKLGMVLD